MFSSVRQVFRVTVLFSALLWASIGSGRAQGRVSIVPAAPAENAASADQTSEAGTTQRSANYQLSAGDAVAIKVFREPTLDTTQRISKDGTINFPLLGVIKIAGRTTNEAATTLAALLDKDYIVHPQVAVSIVTYIKQKYTMLGQVSSPGSYEIPEEQTVDLLTAVARAGGFTRLANPAKVTVRRVKEGQEEVFNIDAKRLMNDKRSTRFFIQPNDTISVAERFF